MRYRVYFRLFPTNGLYYTEWFDTLAEAMTFVFEADGSVSAAAGGAGVFVRHVENEDGEII